MSVNVNELEQNDVAIGQGMKASYQFNEYGRCIPAESLKAAAHKESRRYFQIMQPKIDYQIIYNRLNERFHFDEQLTVDDFQSRAEAILQKLGADIQFSNVTQGVGVPFILPKAQYDDIGKALESDYLPGLEASFQGQFPAYSFVNHCSESLDGKLSVVEGSRHDELLAAMQKEVVVGYYFPSLLEYSVPASIEQVGKLPAQFLLAGGFDTAAAFIGSPDLLLRTDGYPPLLWLSGLTTGNINMGYHFEAYGYGLTFNRRAHLGNVAEYWASGLVVLG